MSSWIYNFVGFGGVFLILLAFFLLQAEKIKSTDAMYSILNLAGAAMLLFSLFFAWNWAGVIINVAWMAISLYGLVQALRTTNN
jgi:paired small multidrug resistance pump